MALMSLNTVLRIRAVAKAYVAKERKRLDSRQSAKAVPAGQKSTRAAK